MIDDLRLLLRQRGLVVEPSGAATTTAALGLGGIDPAKGSVVAMVSCGNVAPEAFAKYLAS